MRHGNMPSAPNYTNAALVMALVNLLWVLGVVWATLGLPAVLAVGYVLNLLITRIEQKA